MGEYLYLTVLRACKYLFMPEAILDNGIRIVTSEYSGSYIREINSSAAEFILGIIKSHLHLNWRR